MGNSSYKGHFFDVDFWMAIRKLKDGKDAD